MLYKRTTIFIGILFVCFFVSSVSAQNKVITYINSDDDFANPDRGFYLASGETPGKLSVEELKKLRTIYSIKSPNAKYATYITLIYKGYLLTDFRNSSISETYLAAIQKDFDAVREAGLKIILRFSYIDKVKSGDCPDKDICPPYGDAPKHIVIQHLQQLKPLFMKNSDVVSVYQQGFIGIWGENHYTDYFGDASRNDLGYVPDSSWLDRSEVLKAYLDAIPKDRMVQVRTPQLQQKFVYGPNASISSKPNLQNHAFDLSDVARIGFHNDCFLASIDDYGTYSDYGNSLSKKEENANEILRKYFIEESKYLAVGGETCDNAFSPQNDCEPLGHAIKEMKDMHYSFLNVSYNNLVNNDWETQGCMSEIKRKLGYRFVLKEGIFPEKIKLGSSFHVKLKLENEGFASPYNPRPVQLIFRNKKDKSVYHIDLKANVQKWFSGEIEINENINLPTNLKKGSYELLLALPDTSPSLRNKPAYSIRFANQFIWEENSGFNKLNHTITIR